MKLQVRFRAAIGSSDILAGTWPSVIRGHRHKQHSAACRRETFAAVVVSTVDVRRTAATAVIFHAPAINSRNKRYITRTAAILIGCRLHLAADDKIEMSGDPPADSRLSTFIRERTAIDVCDIDGERPRPGVKSSSWSQTVRWHYHHRGAPRSPRPARYGPGRGELGEFVIATISFKPAVSTCLRKLLMKVRSFVGTSPTCGD